MSEETTVTTTTTEALPPRCCVRHKDAGGQCERPGAVRVYGIGFCAEHGEEARLGALIEEHDEVYTFFERFRNPHVISLSSPIERVLGAALDHTHAEVPAGTVYDNALLRAYPDPPEDVRARVTAWEQDEEPGYAPVMDACYDSLRVIHKLMRVAYEEEQTWLVEMLEQERQVVAAEAACALSHRREDARKDRPAE